MFSKILDNKLTKAALSLALVATLLVSCSNAGTNESESTKDGGSDETTVESQDGEVKENVEITYVNWNLGTEEENNMERRMIQAYMDKNPNVKIKIADYIDVADYGGSLTNAAAGGRMPDVFMLQTIPQGLNGDWLLDVKPYTANDEDWKKIADSVIESLTYGSHEYAIPSGQFLAGFFVNANIFEDLNIPQPKYGYKMEELVEAIKATTSQTNGTLGIENELDILNWYPYSQDNNLGWYTWDGEKYNIDNSLLLEGVNISKDLFQNKTTFDALSEEERTQYEGENAWELWMAGKTAFKYDSSSILTNAGELPFKLEFIGLPGGTQTLITDYMGINKDTKKPEVAYDFAKWMTFSKEGQMKRYEIADEIDAPWNSVPLINDSELLESYLAGINANGIEEAFENIDHSVVEAVKVIPGFAEARWTAQTGVAVGENENASIGDILFNSIRGNLNIEDYASQLNDLANQQTAKAQEAIKSDIN